MCAVRHVSQEVSREDWTPYEISDGRFSNRRELSAVAHTCHIQNGLDILRDGTIRSALVGHDTHLRGHNISAVWLSPNNWPDGSVFGNVSFTLDWAKLVDGKRFYWVGVVENKTPTCRILVTSKHCGNFLIRYRPRNCDGPWERKGNKHYWNNDCALHFIFEDNIPISNVRSIEFVSHHKQRCANNCSDLQEFKDSAAYRFLAGACVNGLLSKHRHLWVKDGEPTEALKNAWHQLRQTIEVDKTTGSAGTTGAAARSFALAGLWHILGKRYPEAETQFRQFKNPLTAVKSCAKLIEHALSLEPRILPWRWQPIRQMKEKHVKQNC